ncbi:putative MFS family arabinose efflux permease [Enterobacter sp. BIGb0383]|uniref:MFS transporter n=1 Tax=unclassified Enterobacter TaxID=2608935 RepID=UPI000F475D6E|nr:MULTISPECIES: MFS transporter [unclassified Enterobacter]ROP62242.1 putative MFS family arabinose efflux permease [Enterobacter sp. BIGb0383]ROS12403.1 putative MFS family arabinose efflux permease [Enterobacter sp. BIGb0359]
MANQYRDLFSAPGTGYFAAAGLLARLPLPMAGIGIITLLSQLRGSYALAGAVSATFVMAYALLSPQISRYVDRYGQHRVLPVATAMSISGFLILIAGSHWNVANGILFLGALLAGFMPSISAMVRARWTALYRSQPRLQTAYSLETVLDELTFIVGPPLSIGLSVTLFYQAGLLLATLLLLVGVSVLVMQRGTEPPVVPVSNATAGSGSVIRIPGVRLLTLLMVAMGVIVGTVDIVSIAYAEQLGLPAAASLVLSAYAVGSCLAGLVYGSLRLKTPLHRLLLLGGVATAATTIPLILATNLIALTIAVLVAGLFFAPTMIVAMSLIERRVSEYQLTEGMTWLLAGLNVGIAFGAAIAGQVVDGNVARAGFSVALVAGVVVLLLVLLSHLILRKQRRQHPAT